MAPRIGLKDFEIGRFVGRRRPESIGEGDVVSAKHLGTGQTFALKRIEVESALPDVEKLFYDLTRAAKLQKHKAWLGFHADMSFIQEYADHYGHKRARCCVVEELADRNLENEIVERSVSDQPFEAPQIFQLWATLLHGLQALHAQGVLHRNICTPNIFFVGEDIKLGTPGPTKTPTSVFYPHQECNAYSADIFALGLLFLEMALLHPMSDLVLGSHQALFDEILSLDTAGLCSWINDQAQLLGRPHLDNAIVKVLVAMLTGDPQARPTADDLLDWPAFAPWVNANEVLPVEQRPCVVMAHRGLALRDVPRRSVVNFPDCHQIFSYEGASEAQSVGRYCWSGSTYDLWWFEEREFKHGEDTSDLRLLAVKPTGIPDAIPKDGILKQTSPAQARATAISSLDYQEATVNSAYYYRIAGKLLASEVYYRAALLAEPDQPSTWLGLASVQFERGNLMAGRILFEHCRQVIRASVEPVQASVRLFGLCEFFVAVEGLKTLAQRVLGGSPGSESRSLTEILRSSHVSLYYRSTLAMEAGDAEAFAALGEYYRVIGQPQEPLRNPVPDLATARSYFEQAKTIVPNHAYVLDRLRRMKKDHAYEEDEVSAEELEAMLEAPLPPPESQDAQVIPQGPAFNALTRQVAAIENTHAPQSQDAQVIPQGPAFNALANKVQTTFDSSEANQQTLKPAR